MPRFPVIEAQQAPQGFLQPAPVGIVDLSGLAQGAQVVGRAAMEMRHADQQREAMDARQLQHELKAQQRDEARVLVNNTIQAKKADLQEQFAAAQETAAPGAPGFTANALKNFDDWAMKAEQAAPDAGRLILKQQLGELRAHVHQTAFDFETKARRGKLVTDFNAGLEDAGRVVWSDPSQYMDARARAVATARNLEGLPAALREQMSQGATDKLTNLAALRLAELDPLGTLKALGYRQEAPSSVSAPGGSWVIAPEVQAARDAERMKILEREANDPNLDEASRAAVRREMTRVRLTPSATVTATTAQNVVSISGQPGDVRNHIVFGSLAPEKLDDIARHAMTQLQRGVAIDRTRLQAREKDVQSMVLSGVAPPAAAVPTESDYMQAFGPEGAQRYRDNIADFLAVGDGLRQMQTASAADRRAIIDRYAPVAGAGFDHQSRMQESLRQANTLIEKQMAADPAAYVLQNDPKTMQARQQLVHVMGNPQAGDMERKRAVGDYAERMLAEQQRLGVPELRIDERGEAAPNRQHVPRLLTNSQANGIVQQVATSGANAAQVIDGLSKQWGTHWPQVYAQLAADDKLPPTALVIPNMSDPFSKERLARWSTPAEAKGIKERLPAGAEKDIEGKLQSQNEAFFNTLTYQEGGGKTYGAILGAQKTLAMGYMAQGKGASDAARQAFDETVGHAYQFEGTMRIPKAEQPEQVIGGARLTLNAADKFDLQLPPARPGMTPAATRSAWVDVVKNRGFFVVNGDESGVQLYVTANTPSGPQGVAQVLDHEGRPMSFSWSQLRSAYTDDVAKRSGRRKGSLDREGLRQLRDTQPQGSY